MKNEIATARRSEPRNDGHLFTLNPYNVAIVCHSEERSDVGI